MKHEPKQEELDDEQTPLPLVTVLQTGPTGPTTKGLSRAIGNQAMQQLVQGQMKGDMAQSEAAVTDAPDLIVSDTAPTLAPGQMRRRDFLALLESAVTQTADAALQNTIWTAVGCPYIDAWFAYYNQQESQHIVRALHKFVPETRQATSIEAYIDLTCRTLDQRIREWAITGEMSDLPDGLTAEPALRAQLGQGQAINAPVRSRLAHAFGTDLPDLRVHTGSRAGQLARNADALAVTMGSDIAFAPGQYQPGTLVGDALLAHEMAHVLQQQRASTQAASTSPQTAESHLEQDANRSVMGVMAALWGKGSGLKETAVPALQSGLTLQRCSIDKPDTVEKAEVLFKEENIDWADELTADEADYIIKSIDSIRSDVDNEQLLLEYYYYYADEEFERTEAFDDENTYAKTQGGETTLPDKAFKMPPKLLALILFHEYVHTHQPTVAMGMGDYLEGRAYGAEMALAQRAQVQERIDEINKIYDSYGFTARGQAFRKSYNTYLITLNVLYDVVDGKPLPEKAPNIFKDMSADEAKKKAKALIVEVFSKEPDDWSDELKRLSEWTK